MNSAIPVGHKVKMKKEGKKLDAGPFPERLKKLLNMKVTVILVIVEPLEPPPTNLEKRLSELEIRGKLRLLKSSRIHKRVLEICKDSSEKLPIRTDMKNSQ